MSNLIMNKNQPFVKISEENTIWTFKCPPESVLYIEQSILDEHKSRFGWSNKDHHNLSRTENCNKNVNENFGDTKFLLQVQEGDWIVHINCPAYGQCLAAKVISKYQWDQESSYGDFRHFFSIDQNSIVKFDRNNPVISPAVKLALPGKQWKIYEKENFEKSINRIIQGNQNHIDHLQESVHELTHDFLKKTASEINKYYPNTKLEVFIKDLLKKIPGISNVMLNKERTQHGADIIFYRDIIGNYGVRVVAQVKSYKNPMDDITAINQIKEAIDHHGGIGIIITTATEFSDKFIKELNNASQDADQNIYLLNGVELARMVFTYSIDSIFSFNGSEDQ